MRRKRPEKPKTSEADKLLAHTVRPGATRHEQEAQAAESKWNVVLRDHHGFLN